MVASAVPPPCRYLSNFSEEILNIVLALAVVRQIAGNAHRGTGEVQDSVELVKLEAEGRGEHVVLQGLEAEHHDLLGLGEGREIGLLKVMVCDMDVEGVKPAAAVVPGPHGFKVGHEGEGEIAGKMLVRGDGIPRFGSGVDPVKELALGGRIIAGFLIALRPVRILDGDAASGIGCLCGSDDIL